MFTYNLSHSEGYKRGYSSLFNASRPYDLHIEAAPCLTPLSRCSCRRSVTILSDVKTVPNRGDSIHGLNTPNNGGTAGGTAERASLKSSGDDGE